MRQLPALAGMAIITFFIGSQACLATDEQSLPEKDRSAASQHALTNDNLAAGDYGVDYNTECEGLLARDHDWAAATKGDNIDEICDFWSRDAVFYFPDGKVLSGIDQIKKYVVDNRANPGFKLERSPSKAFVSDNGDVGITKGVSKLSFVGKDGKRVTQTVNYTNVWKKIHGEWKCVISSSD